MKVINDDLRAYGYSDKPATPVTMTDLCEDVVAVCPQEGANEAVFAGVSVGGVIGLQLGLDHRELFKARLSSAAAACRGTDTRAAFDGYINQGVGNFHYSTPHRPGQQGTSRDKIGKLST